MTDVNQIYQPTEIAHIQWMGTNEIPVAPGPLNEPMGKQGDFKRLNGQISPLNHYEGAVCRKISKCTWKRYHAFALVQMVACAVLLRGTIFLLNN